MKQGFLACLQIFPAPDIMRTADYYERLGFRAVHYLNAAEPHICLYRDSIEIVLTQSKHKSFVPNRELHGYGYDGYFITDDQKGLESELEQLGVTIVRPLSVTDYNNKEFVFEDVDGRWIAVGKKV
ncbi:glyoxalase [Paenibacillus sp. CAA11]|uniref:VOC family protein n=1 Tax=Paenibacillus sp. CAA11 TaxID=1532905 RepID=UPI000D3D6BB9|nr:VOC family protein [Paenibacillus sp. CAA11]AWB43083.1 glyoxalase [Paenibacillus sp. CAA11]